MRTITTNLFLLLMGAALLLAAPAAIHAQGQPVAFSADFIDTDNGDIIQGKYYASPEGIRLESASDGEPFITIVNFAHNRSWMVQVQERTYLEIPFQPEDAGDFLSPCPELTTPRKVGSETLQGRKVEKWLCERPGRARGAITVWFDPRLQAAIRSEDGKKVTEMRNIKEGRQPSELFQPPTGYTKMEMPGMDFFGGFGE
ncbi:hypothetical protein [Desulfurivibrio dismutans]|uniref:hypothetical protein n=1 Tax=Desulfurivibrio dismutans TaxID=1398908 RepID=UPI0023DA2798|nr:hypothetical protein [Desulfurivibrio alkaliphilus]MDF1615496.1 hypothetical protein [Desulfurivibrio alkaliphilus]